MSSIITSILNAYPISRIRRNHGLEHATIHLLSRKFPGIPMAGHSDTGGFWIISSIDTQEIDAAANQALSRLKSGERKLAVHPNCGTNFVTAGMAAGVAGAFSMFGAGRRWMDRLGRIPLAITLATLALIFSRPLGLKLQETITTSGDPGDMEIVKITPAKQGNFTAHRVITKG